ncbi:MAG: TlpA family protein disulfide reductase [Planctomycetia bacterium]|nr:TlpA family protein disulfide reductase [Planctomycetia bacterium]
MDAHDTNRSDLRAGQRQVAGRWWLLVMIAVGWSGPVVPAAAADAHNMKITAAGIRLGGQVSGPQLTDQSLAHHVVVLEFWGVHCPPCIASMPKLEALHRQLGPSGLIVVGAHAQGGEPAEVKKVVDELGVTFPIVENAQVADGMDFEGIPHCMVFDHTGQCIFRGSPAEAHESVIAAVRLAPAAVLEGKQLVKLAALGASLQNEANLAGVLRKSKGLVKSKDEATAEEARYVVEKVEAHGRRMLEQAVEAKATDPVRAAGLLQRCAAGYKGTDIGIEAMKIAREWKKDKSFMDAIR